MEYKELTHKIIGAAMEVHKILGNGLQEVIYQRALAIELADNNINFSREHKMNIQYKQQDIGTRRVYLLISEPSLFSLNGFTTINLKNHEIKYIL